MNEIDGFLRALHDNPADETTWQVLADWLEEFDDPRRAELLRLHRQLLATCCKPDQHPKRAVWQARVVELLTEGRQPCLPGLTNSIGMKLTLIPAGSFLMGSPAAEPQRSDDEGPQRQVTISAELYLGIYPVTQREYEAVMGNNPACFHKGNKGNKGGPDHPVEQVTWENAADFCKRLSALSAEKSARRAYRLPTEAEWEYACRAGTTTPFWFGTAATSTQANFNGEHPYGGSPKGQYLGRTSKAGSYPGSPWGLFDMHGNVWEWCQDWFDENYYRQGHNKDPQGPQSGSDRVLRGGSWDGNGLNCRAACRSCNGAADRRNGFRVVMTLPPGLS